MRFKGQINQVINLLVRGMVRWLEMLGENPPLSRDHGIFAWRYLNQANPPARIMVQEEVELEDATGQSIAPARKQDAPWIEGSLPGRSKYREKAIQVRH